MPRLINGFSDVIGSYNLAINGRFRINQRGAFTPNPEIATTTQLENYISDCWKVYAVDIDNIKVENQITAEPYGSLEFIGYGTKGQSITISSIDADSSYPGNAMYGSSRVLTQNGMSYNSAYTVAVNCYKSATSIPVKIEAFGPRNGTEDTQYSSSPILESGESSAVAVEAAKVNTNQLIDDPPRFKITLEDTGNFSFTITDFRLFAGLYRNPPEFGIVSYADDLARCLRYYQKLRIKGSLIPIYNTSGSNSFARMDIPLQMPMAGLPSYSVNTSSTLIGTYQGPEHGTGKTVNDSAGNWAITVAIVDSYNTISVKFERTAGLVGSRSFILVENLLIDVYRDPILP